MRRRFWAGLLLLLLCSLFLLTGCHSTPELSVLLKPLLTKAEEAGYSCSLLPLAQTGDMTEVAIYDSSVWYQLLLNQEEVLVYFDSSNRASYLIEQFCNGKNLGYFGAVGLRFIVNYRGTDPDVLAFLQSQSQ